MRPIIIFLAALMSISAACNAQSQESKFKALFVLKFISNVSWPQDKKNLVIGVVGKSDVLSELEARLQSRNPNGMTIRKISVAEAETCDVIFLSSDAAGAMASIYSSVKSRSSLVISETDLSKRGCGISFVEQEGKLAFIVNKAVIEASGLTISSALLNLGKQS